MYTRVEDLRTGDVQVLDDPVTFLRIRLFLEIRPLTEDELADIRMPNNTHALRAEVAKTHLIVRWRGLNGWGDGEQMWPRATEIPLAPNTIREEEL